MRPLKQLMNSVTSRGVRCLAVAAALALPLAWSATASAESGAHRQPPPPPAITDVVLAEPG